MAIATQALMKPTATKLNVHQRPQQGDLVDYLLLRINQECGPPWSTDEEVREMLRKDPRASGTVYGTHYAIRGTQKEMVPTPVRFADAPGDAAHAELWAHNPFAMRSSVTSTATLPTHGQAGCIAEGDSPPAAGSLLKDSRRAREVVWEWQVSAKTEPAESPMNEQSEAMLIGVQVGVDERQSVPTRQHSV